MKGLITGLFLLFTFATQAQTTWLIQPYNYEWKRGIFDSTLRVPIIASNRAYYTGKDSIGLLWFNPDSVKLFGRFPGNIIKTVVTYDTIVSLKSKIPGLVNQSANTVYAGPSSGAAAIASFRQLVPIDIPSIYKGKKFLVIGDSFTALGLFQDSLVKYLGITVINDGISGSCITGGTIFAEGDGIARKPIVDRIDAQLALYADLDGIIIEGGSNDWNYAARIGDIAVPLTDTTSFYGAYKYILSKCAAYSRPLTILPVTLMQRNGTPHNGPATTGRANYEAQLKYQKAIVACANLYGVPVADIFHGSGMTFENSGIYTSDGTHPSTDAGRFKYSQFLIQSINKQIVPGIDNNRLPLTGFFESTGTNKSDSMTNPIFALGSQFAPSTFGLGTMYGIGYTGSNAIFLPVGSSGWGMYAAANGTAKVFLSATNGDIVGTGNLSTSTAGIGITSAPTSTFQVNGSLSILGTTITIGATLGSFYIYNVNNSTNITLNLPVASTCPWRVYSIKKVSNNANTINIHQASGTIDGSASDVVISAFNVTTILYNDGTNWFIQ